MRTRIFAVLCTAAVTFATTGGTALAHFCTNASKPVGAGTKVVFNEVTGEVTFTNPSYLNQIERAGKDPEAGELRGGFIGIDFDGDGQPDADTYNHPKGVVPAALKDNGQDCKGMTNFAADCTFPQK